MILETGTSNLLFIKHNKIYTPKKVIMKVILLNFLKVKLRKIIKKIYLLKDLKIMMKYYWLVLAKV